MFFKFQNMTLQSNYDWLKYDWLFIQVHYYDFFDNVCMTVRVTVCNYI